MSEAPATASEDESTGDPVADQEAGAQGRPRRRRRWWWLGALAIVVVAIVVAAMLRQASLAAPRDLAVQYLEAIAAGDVATANDLAPDSAFYGLPAAGSMDDAERITDVWVSESSTTTNVQTLSGDEFLAEGFDVRYDLDGETYEDHVWIERVETSWLTSEWRIRDSLAREGTVHGVYAAGVPVQVRIGGASITLDAGTTEQATPLYPGIYPVVVADSELVTGGETSIAVTDAAAGAWVHMGPLPETAPATSILVEPSPAMDEVAVTLAAEQLTTCAALAAADDDRLWCDGDAIALDSAGYALVQQGATVSWAQIGDVTAARDETRVWAWNVDAVIEATVTTQDGVVTTERFDVTELVSIGGPTFDDLAITSAGGWFLG